MANNLNHQEEKLKHILENLEMDIDTSLLWDSIESRVEKPKRRFGFLWLSLLTGVFLVGGFLATYWFKSHNVPQDQVAAKLATNEHITAAEKPVITANSSEAIVYKTDTNETLDKHVNKPKLVPTKNVNKKAATNQSTLNQAYNTLNLTTIHRDNLSKNLTTISEKTEKANSLKTHNNSFTNTLNSANDLVTTLNKLNRLHLRPLSLDDHVFLLSNDHIDPIDVKLAALKKSLIPQFFIAIKSGANISFTDPNLTRDVEYFNAKEFTKEEGLVGYDFNVQLGRYLNDAWKITAGIGFNNQTVRYTNQEQVTIVEEVDIVDIEYDNVGNATEILSKAEQTTTNNYDIQWHRNHQNINLECLIGKDLLHQNNWRIGLEAGYIFTIASTSKGYYFNDAVESFSKIINNEENPYRVNGLSSAQIGTYVEYKLGKIDLGLYPSFRYHLNSLTNSQHFYSLRNSQLGVQASARYNFGK